MGLQLWTTKHLCKHLVQAVGTPEPNFWRDVYRRRVAPIYRHSALISTPFADDGSITDGDDHVWTGNRTILGQGQWRDVVADVAALTASSADQVLGKRCRESEDIIHRDLVKKKRPNSGSPSAVDEESNPRSSPGFEEITPASFNCASSPGFEEIEPPIRSSSPGFQEIDPPNLASSPGFEEIPPPYRSSSPIEYGSGDEAE
ncbi:hypothetical protein H0H92_007078, partial [Tricholoma furcatifolium]